MGNTICRTEIAETCELVSNNYQNSCSTPWFCDVEIDWNGCRKFPRLPPLGEHPRLLFTKSEIPRLLARFSHTEIAPQLDRILKGSAKDFLNRYEKVTTNLSSEELQNPTSKETVQEFLKADEHECTTFLSAYVYGLLNEDDSIMKKVEFMTIFHAKLILRSHHLATTKDYREKPFDIWHHKNWDLRVGWTVGAASYALLYDLLYNEIDEDQRSIIRKSITEAVKGRRSWGMGWPSRRIQSNWAPYHADLLALCAVTEGEVGFDSEVYALASDLMVHFMDYAVYDSGHPVEDAYALNLAFREGSIAFLIMARRGHNLFNHPHYKQIWTKWVPYALEPCNSGRIYGGSSGNIWEYPTSAIIAKFMFPKDETIDFVYRQFMCPGNMKFSRIPKIQTRLAALAFAIPSTCSTESSPDPTLPLSFVCRARGKVIMRSDWSQNAMWFVLDARPDGFLIGHDTCSRGAFVLSVNGKTWGYCPEWKWYTESTDYSLPHVDGVGQIHKAPFVKLLDVNNAEDLYTYAAADLTYAYNWTWTTWAKFGEDFSDRGYELEPNDPRDFGYQVWWSPNKLYGERNVAFAGVQQWRKRFANVEKVMRSTILVRAEKPFVIICDNIKKDDQTHNYCWAMTVPKDVHLVSFNGTDAILGEDEGKGRRFLIKFVTRNAPIDCVMREISKKDLKPHQDEQPKQIVFTCRSPEVFFKFLLFSLPTKDSELPKISWSGDGDILNVQPDAESPTYSVFFKHGDHGETCMSAKKIEEKALELLL